MIQTSVILQEWRVKCSQAKTEKQKAACQREIEKLEKKLHAENLEKINNQDFNSESDIKIFLTQSGLVTWNKTEKTIDCDGAVFTENELLNLHSVGDNLSPFELELKRKIPFTFYMPELNTEHLHIQREWKGF